MSRGTFGADIESPDEAYRTYLHALARSGGREVGIFRNVATGRYAVQIGGKFDVAPPVRGDWA